MGLQSKNAETAASAGIVRLQKLPNAIHSQVIRRAGFRQVAGHHSPILCDRKLRVSENRGNDCKAHPCDGCKLRSPDSMNWVPWIEAKNQITSAKRLPPDAIRRPSTTKRRLQSCCFASLVDRRTDPSAGSRAHSFWRATLKSAPHTDTGPDLNGTLTSSLFKSLFR
jgi:hypothetical protein